MFQKIKDQERNVLPLVIVGLVLALVTAFTLHSFNSGYSVTVLPGPNYFYETSDSVV